MKQEMGGIAFKVKPDTEHGALSLSLIRGHRIPVKRRKIMVVIPERSVDLLHSEEGDGRNQLNEGKWKKYWAERTFLPAGV
ncbi:MAG: hypothetical protein A4E62_02194 [Syntrophorhabdus sp. PtaU1.Bin002]|nr:MAG: hypothetical protein A4E58_00673 [Syntrophorhabdus sp. PtaB.Bin006]OPY67770.1 MAG: hypothetical protein A4E62_02194 [Syntrophorhabdus sp. PtaU1.Bin002]